MQRWIRNVKNRRKISGKKYGDILIYLLKKYNQDPCYKEDSDDSIIYIFRCSYYTFVWEHSPEGFDYWCDFFNEFEDLIKKAKL